MGKGRQDDFFEDDARHVGPLPAAGAPGVYPQGFLHPPHGRRRKRSPGVDGRQLGDEGQPVAFIQHQQGDGNVADRFAAKQPPEHGLHGKAMR